MMSGEDSSLVMEDRGSNDEPKTPDFPKKTKTSYDVIIIGAGPAGYTAGIYCSRARHDTLIISGLLPGGQLMNTTDVENYPGFDEGIMGPDLMLTMRKQAERSCNSLYRCHTKKDWYRGRTNIQWKRCFILCNM